jgi:RND superfamily putative drug exporter
MSSLLYRLGHQAVRARRLVVIGWVVLLVGLGSLAVGVMGNLDNEISIPGTEATAALARVA